MADMTLGPWLPLLAPRVSEIGSILGNLILKLSITSGPHTSLPIWGTEKAPSTPWEEPSLWGMGLSPSSPTPAPDYPTKGKRLWLQLEGWKLDLRKDYE